MYNISVSVGMTSRHCLGGVSLCTCSGDVVDTRTSNPSTAEAGAWRWGIQGQPGLHIETIWSWLRLCSRPNLPEEGPSLSLIRIIGRTQILVITGQEVSPISCTLLFSCFHFISLVSHGHRMGFSGVVYRLWSSQSDNGKSNGKSTMD